jgi:hypothetical protein
LERADSNDVDAPGEGYATGDQLTIQGGTQVAERLKVTSTQLVLTDDAQLAGEGYSVAERLTITDADGWATPPVIEVTAVDDAGQAEKIEVSDPGVYSGSQPIDVSQLTLKPMPDVAMDAAIADAAALAAAGASYDGAAAGSYGAGAGSYDAGTGPPIIQLSAASEQERDATPNLRGTGGDLDFGSLAALSALGVVALAVIAFVAKARSSHTAEPEMELPEMMLGAVTGLKPDFDTL